jgi:hypothetical protein
MPYLSKIRARMSRGGLKAFQRDEAGSVVIEGVIGSLMLFGWMVVSFQMYDAFKVRSEVTRSTYMIADMISRQRDPIGPKYVKGLQKVFNFLTNAQSDNQTWVRVTLFKCKAETGDAADAYCDGKTKKFTLIDGASYATPGVDGLELAEPYTQAGLDAISDRIPVMAVGDMAVITETMYRYKPFVDFSDKSLVGHKVNADGSFGAEETLFAQQGLYTGLRYPTFVVTRPREPRVTWDDDS